MGFIKSTLLDRRYELFFMAVIVFLTHLPSNSFNYFADDFIIWTHVTGSESLTEKGFEIADPDRSVWQKIKDTYHFFSAKQGTLQQQLDYGNMPWWSSRDATMVPFRPLAGFTHWLDFNINGKSQSLVRWHSLVYFVFFGVAGFIFYRSLTEDRRVYWLAALLLAFDFSMSANYAWLAARNSYMTVGFGVLWLYCHNQWRSTDQRQWPFLAVVFQLLAILSAEAGIAAFGYVVAYGLIMDKAGWRKGLISATPYVVVILLWRYYYNIHGFGSSGIGLYLDPGRDIVEFAKNFVVVFPVICLTQISSIDGLITGLAIDLRLPAQLIAWGIFLAVLFLTRNFILRNKTAQYLLVGSVIAAIPHASLISSGYRSGTFVAIGFLFVLAMWIVEFLAKSKALWKRLVAMGLILLHLVGPLLVLLTYTWNFSEVIYPEDYNYKSVQKRLEKRPDSTLVIVNHLKPSNLFYLPYEWDFNNQIVPKRVQALAPGLTPMMLTRISDTDFVLESKRGFIVHQDAKMRTFEGAPDSSSEYSRRMVQGLITDPDYLFSKGQKLTSAEMDITILEMVRDVPSKVQFHFADEAPEAKIWQWYDYKVDEFKQMDVLKVGESRYFPGPFEFKD